MKTSKQIRQIKSTLMNGNCIFTVEGIETYQKLDSEEYGMALQSLSINENGTYISEVDTIGMGGSMNVSKFTEKTIHLFTYSILHNQVKGKINYQDVTIIEIL
tara:strand:+ start:964 stop:1272 length:309 start_codon:yes stop_codon:yes gene_type:complete